MTLRMTQNLFALIDRAASHIDRDRSYIARATVRWLERGAVIQTPIDDCITKSGTVYVSFRDVTLPEDISPATFRAALHARCTEALQKRGVVKFVPAAVEGRDYVIAQEEG